MKHLILIGSVTAIAFGLCPWPSTAVAQTPTADSLNLKQQEAKMFSTSAGHCRARKVCETRFERGTP